MADRSRAFCIEELPAHLILEILSCGRLGAVDLACLETTCRMFNGAHGLLPDKFRSMVDFAAFNICMTHTIFGSLPQSARTDLLGRCHGNWKKVLRFLQSVEQSSCSVETSAGNVFTCGDNSSFCCGHGEAGRTIYRPTRIEALKGIPCKQISAGASYTFAVTYDGRIHSFGSCNNFCLGHGDQHDELVPRVIQSFRRRNIHILRVSAGDEHAVALDSSGYVCARKRKTFVLTDEGSVFAFGWMGFGSLGFSDRGSSDKVMKPRVLDSLKSHHVTQISTGLYHTVGVTNRGLVFGFGDNERAQLGHEKMRGCLKPTEIVVQTMDDIAIAAQSGSRVSSL
ncbi:hypothetical protein B296_00036878 [Ensete ventricosum]|uniref:F-box domain-containing protein n=1 Tax=Ensete ventricosum TaxID=4639 RepID=A0A426ZYM0_ENSVE|nr:hypothetical protein B296_00036878 [Ensete ventricosum]